MSDRSRLCFSHAQSEYLIPDSEILGIWSIWSFTDDFDWFQERYHSGTPDAQVLRVRDIDLSLWPNRYFPGMLAGDARGNSHAIEYSLFRMSEFLRLAQ